PATTDSPTLSLHDALPISAQFKAKTNFRQYVALLDGYLSQASYVRESYLMRDTNVRTRFQSMELSDYETRYGFRNDKPSHLRFAKTSFYKEITYGQRLTKVRIELATGRTHQIRVHAKDIGRPVLGDQVYGRKQQLPHQFPVSLKDMIAGLRRQMLHAQILGFEHPISRKKVAFEAPL